MFERIYKRYFNWRSLLFAVVVLLCVCAGYLFVRSGQGSGIALSLSPGVPSEALMGETRVRIDGRVKRPGIYYVPEGTTVERMINGYAQGLLEGADAGTYDMEQIVWDGMSIYIE